MAGNTYSIPFALVARADSGYTAYRSNRGVQMVEADKEKDRIYIVVINYEEQYSIWPKGKAIPAGWLPAGVEGTKTRCLEYIDQTWVDMRPLSLRSKMTENIHGESSTKRRVLRNFVQKWLGQQ